MFFGDSSRRFFLKLLGAAGLVATTDATTGCSAESDDDAETDEGAVSLKDYDYIIVGSGAGGGPLAANLARNKKRVLLLEAGEDRGDTETYKVPAFHAKASEDPAMSWNYYVKHYKDDAKAQKDTKMTWDTPDGKLYVGTQPPSGSKPKGILYPRTGTLGGCTAHNAMITVYPHESDWDSIAKLTGDGSWSATSMRRYFEILERCEYLRTQDSTDGHGGVGARKGKGWLGVDRADALQALKDPKIIKIVMAAANAMGNGLIADIGRLAGLMGRDLNAKGPNKDGVPRDMQEDVFQIPLAMTQGHRNGPREYLKATQKELPQFLEIRTNCLATRVIFKKDSKGEQRAVGVEFMEGANLYKATPKPASGAAPGTSNALLRNSDKPDDVKGEIVLSAGAFNTPQLLKLSGIGPKEELTKFKIPVLADLPGVGTNLQDRYEVGVISEVKTDFSIVGACTFGAAGDPCLNQWRTAQNGFANGKNPLDIQLGPYASNGIAVACTIRSSVAKREGGPADVFVFGGPANFPGYSPGYSDKTVADKKHFTWAILKAHTKNKAGTVTLRSVDPRDTPEIDFKYFGSVATDGSSPKMTEAEKAAVIAAAKDDRQAVAEGVALARTIGASTGNMMGDDIPLLGGKFEEHVPGTQYPAGAPLEEFIENEAWGHHASCTCPIGKDDDPMAVLDSRFRVRKTRGLRVVDASVFPKIPGFFIVVPIYMISEKATDVILEDAGETRKV